MQEPKKVLIAMPTLGLNPNPQEWFDSYNRLLNDIRRHGFSHAFLFPYRTTWWPANNAIWDTAFAHKFDYILRMDDDIWQVPHDAFTSLMEADKDVIGAAYCNRRWPYNVQALVRNNPEQDLVETSHNQELTLSPVQGYGYKGKDVQKVDLIGFGLTLIKTAPFKRFLRPMYKGAETTPDDTYFGQMCLANNIEQYVHFGVRVTHAHVTLENAGHLYNADVLNMGTVNAKKL